jgi:oxygen-dependent protoporphyrinogen oxidase
VTCEDEKSSSIHSLALVTVSSRLLSDLISRSSSKNDITDGDGLAKKLATGPTVTVGLVNLYFSPTPEPLHPPGFGYLLPRTTPFLSNPERALGVIFDSDTISGQDIYPDADLQRGTKMTVMLGGHWWNEFEQLPTEDELSQMALSVLRRHLDIRIEPTIIQASMQKQCIAQYPVGHNQTMMQLRNVLRQVHHGRVRVAGSSYTGVGVNDCVRAGWDAAEEIVRNSKHRDKERYTGLEMFELGEEYQWTAVKKLRR